MAGPGPHANAAQEGAMFVSEGEASLHYAVYNGLPLGALQVRASLLGENEKCELR